MELADRIREAVADRYAVESELGRGGMAVVYLARDLRYDRRVAIKVLRPELSISLVADRFLREIQIAAQLQHPLIVPLYDSGRSEELLWYVMPFVEGETLRDRLRREQQLPLADALAITRDAAQALECAHQHGFVHRDIKPENILLSGGHAVIMDFGIARALTSAAGQGTSSGVAIGTPAYMSPEQASGSGKIDARSDVYSLGCVLYEMLAGEPPFTGPTPQAIIARHISETLPSLAVVRPTIAAPFQAVVERALAKSPADRYPTPERFAAALSAVGEVPSAGRAPGRWWAWLAIPALALIGIAVWASVRRTGGGSAPREIGVQLLPVVTAVSPDTERAKAALAGAALATALEWLPGIRLVGPPPAAAGRPEEPSPAALNQAREQGARYVLLPRMGSSAGRLELTLDLLATEDGSSAYRLSAITAGDSLARVADRLAMSLGLELARRGEVNWGDVGLVARMTSSARAFGLLRQGQRAFARGDPPGAVAADLQALDADPSCVLAYYRLSAARAAEFDYAGGLEAVRRGLAVPHGAGVWTRILEAQRHYLLRQADSSVAAFQRLVLDEQRLPDAWLGLAESLFYLGPYAGFGLTDALAAYQQLVAVDSSFAPVWGRLTALALLQGQPEAARAYAARIPEGDSERPLWGAAIGLVAGDATARGDALRALDHADRSTLSLLFLFLTRRPATLPLADSVARRLIRPDRTPDDRLRGGQYRLLTLAAQGAWPAALDAWRNAGGGSGGAVFDQWIVAADLAGYDAGALAQPMYAWGWRMVTEGKAPDFGRSPDDPVNQAFSAVVHRTAIGGTAAEVDALLRRLAAAPAVDLSDPMPGSLRFALSARRALLGGDTATAVERLRRAVLGPGSPWTAFFPLTGMAPERLLLAELLAARGARPEAERTLNTFENTWAAGDALYAARLPLLRRRLLGGRE
jgi:serine/threonine-protein kinase